MADAREELKGAQFLRLKEGDTNFELVEVKLHQFFLRAVSVKKAEVKLYDLSLISDARPEKLPIMTTHQVEQIKSQIGAFEGLEEHVMCIVYRNEQKWHYIVRPTLYFFFGAKPLIQQWISAVNKRCIFKDFLHIPLLTQLEKMHDQVQLSSPNRKDLQIDTFLRILGADSKRKSKVLECLGKIGYTNHSRDMLNVENLSFQHFFKLYLKLTQDRKDIFQSILTPEKPVLEKKEFQHFINSTQRDPRLNPLNYPPLGVRKVTNLITECNWKKESESISFEGLVKYLMSRDNLEIDTSQFNHLQDMDKPLSHYFINSSHNTYLEGRQMMALGSVEMYIQCMLLGCRCIELDCWDDINDEPVITHGGAFVNKLSFEEVIKAIAQYAFVVTEYPLILSFENRSKNPIVQDKMTQYCKKYFGDMLLDIPLDSHPLEENVFLPSPNMLKRKILIKNKRLLPPVKTKNQSITGIQEDTLTKPALSTLLRSDSKVPQEFEGLKELDEEMSVFEPKGSSTVDQLVNYVQASKFVSFEESFDRNVSYEMFSFSESKAYGFIMNQHKLFTMYNKYQLSRIYPYWKRFNSDNLMPQIFWNVGCHMVALNFQSPDLPIMLNHAKFEYNHRRGFIIKPSCLHLYRHEPFNNFAQVSIPYVVPASFELRILSAQFVRLDVNSKIFVAVEIYGLPADTLRNDASWNTNLVQNNFLVKFDPDLWFKAGRILLPEMAMVKFTVYEEGNKMLAQRTVSFLGLQTGFRHILLRDKNSHPLGISSLFIQVKLEDFVPQEAEAIVQGLVSPQHKDKLPNTEGEAEELLMSSFFKMMSSGESDLDIEIAEEGMKSAPKQVNIDIFLTLQTQRKLPPILEEIMQRSHKIEPLRRSDIGENTNSKSLEAKLIKEAIHLDRAQLAEREKYKKFLLKELNKFTKEIRKVVYKLEKGLTERGIEQEVETRVKVREFELDERMKHKEEEFARAEEAMKISHTLKRTNLAIGDLRVIHQDQVKAVRRKFTEEEHIMGTELSEEERAMRRSGEMSLDKKGLARVRMEIREMITVKKKKSFPQMHRIQKLELDRLMEAQTRYVRSLEHEVNELKRKLTGIIS